jgi:hypothetical protein
VTDRAYLQHRALQELYMTLGADCIEAERAHNALTDSYFQRCVACVDDVDITCGACVLRRACASLAGASIPALA